MAHNHFSQRSEKASDVFVLLSFFWVMNQQCFSLLWFQLPLSYEATHKSTDVLEGNWCISNLSSSATGVPFPRPGEFLKPDTKKTMGTLPAQSIRQTPHSDQTHRCCFLWSVQTSPLFSACDNHVNKFTPYFLFTVCFFLSGIRDDFFFVWLTTISERERWNFKRCGGEARDGEGMQMGDVFCLSTRHGSTAQMNEAAGGRES